MDFDRYELHKLLSQSRNKNQRLEITGMLLYANKKFIQALEGEKNQVLELYNVIMDDSRHFNVTTLMENEIDAREFPHWTMGYKNINSDVYKNIPGITLFLDDEAESPYDLLLNFKNDASCFEVL